MRTSLGPDEKSELRKFCMSSGEGTGGGEIAEAQRQLLTVPEDSNKVKKDRDALKTLKRRAAC